MFVFLDFQRRRRVRWGEMVFGRDCHGWIIRFDAIHGVHQFSQLFPSPASGTLSPYLPSKSKAFTLSFLSAVNIAFS